MTAMPRFTLQELGEPSTPECPECGSLFRRALVPFRLGGRLLGYFPSDVCGNGHEYFTEESGAAIQAASKAHGTWGRARKSGEEHGSSSRGRRARARPKRS